MKKLLLGLGTIAAVAAPVISVISCGIEENKSEQIYNKLDNYQKLSLINKVLKQDDIQINYTIHNLKQEQYGGPAEFVSDKPGIGRLFFRQLGLNDSRILIMLHLGNYAKTAQLKYTLDLQKGIMDIPNQNPDFSTSWGATENGAETIETILDTGFSIGTNTQIGKEVIDSIQGWITKHKHFDIVNDYTISEETIYEGMSGHEEYKVTKK